MALPLWFKRVFSWWDGATFGTLLWTRRFGQKVGEDASGNAFYQNADGSRRWVIYNGESEASRISPDWFGWLHGTWDKPPTEAPLKRRPWERPYVPNLTGTPFAYAPEGSIRRAAPVERKDYEPWTPE